MLASLLFAAALAAQPDPNAAKVDALFEKITRTTPGYSVAVVRDGKTILAKGYGMADLERDVPLAANSVFDIGSTSKQFTAACVLLLEAEGKLSLDDDVRKFVPEMPAYERPITIRHLLHHTSGIRDYLTLMGLSGISFSNDYSDEETLSWITRQKALNFAPGDEHLYSNSGYYLLSHVVERAAGKSLRQYAHERIFQPLGMTSTHYHDDPTELVKHRAIGYALWPNGGTTIDISLNHVVGDGGIYTTVEDLLKWDANFYDPKVGGPKLIEGLLRPGKLTSGEELDYASGLMHIEHKGLKTVRHGGGWAGYRAEMMRFPGQRFTVVVLANFGSADPTAMATQIADIYLQPAGAAPSKGAASAPAGAATAPQPSAAELQPLTGLYYGAALSLYRDIEVRDGKLWYVRGGQQPASELRAAGPNRFEMVGVPSPSTLTFTKDGFTLRTVQPKPTTFVRVRPYTPSAEELSAYAGEYASDELMAPQRLRVKEGRLVARAGFEREEHTLRPRERDTFDAGGLIVRFERDAQGAITGYTVSAGRVKGIRFTRRP